MALPKRRHSSTRRDKRRGGHRVKKIVLEKCNLTGVFHKPHIAYFHNGELYYRGKRVVTSTEK